MIDNTYDKSKHYNLLIAENKKHDKKKRVSFSLFQADTFEEIANLRKIREDQLKNFVMSKTKANEQRLNKIRKKSPVSTSEYNSSSNENMISSQIGIKGSSSSHLNTNTLSSESNVIKTESENERMYKEREEREKERKIREKEEMLRKEKEMKEQKEKELKEKKDKEIKELKEKEERELKEKKEKEDNEKKEKELLELKEKEKKELEEKIRKELEEKIKKEIEEKLKKEAEDPEIAFRKMEGYVKMVVKGVNPSLILCGAPGVGKTYRVRQTLKNAGYIEEKNLFTIKGKCTARRLYLALYEYKDKGDILLIDDADSLVGPKAPEDCINILKGALDSTSEKEGRLITYGVAGKITDDDGNELPKRFYYNGSVIIITNYNAGSLDTALRGRSYIQDIHFSTESVLKLIKQIMPNLNAEKISMQSKIKAYDYLVELVKSGMDMEVSIRTFSICSTLFESMEGDDELAKIMIKEQMKLQSDRIKNKY